ncbi:MAG: PTS system nitrogen regulatory IIA component [Halieaceae bacterium]
MNTVAQILTPQRCLCQIQGGSKKRLFETVADVLDREQEEFHPTELVAGMLARENLGSTGLGNGIAIPHCRLSDCTEACGVLISFSDGTDFDAPDERKVDLLFALIVPSEATQEHLNLLAELAKLFSQESFCRALRECRTSEALYTTTANWTAEPA